MMTLRNICLVIVTFLCTGWQPNGVRAQSLLMDLTGAGVGVQPVGLCNILLANADCSATDGNQEITVAPSARYGFYFEWENVGVFDFTDVRATDQMGNLLFTPVTTILAEGETDDISSFRTAPDVPGVYDILVTVTASSINGSDSEQFRYFLTVDASLPVTLTAFTATNPAKNKVDVRWETAEEINNQGFTVERSADGIAFTDVGAVAGAAHVGEAGQYHFSDTSVPAGRNFYRLRQTDWDGTETLSRVVAVTVESGVGVYPNPVNDELRLTGFRGRLVTVHDGLGRTVLSGRLDEGRGLNVAGLRSGMYWLRVGEEIVRFLKR